LRPTWCASAARGRYCFEQNTLFRAVLEAIGFEVTALAARVRLGTEQVRARTHMLLRVDLPEGPVVADVGFGADGFVHPLPLAVGEETWIGASGYRLRREDELWVLEASLEEAWVDLYAFTLEPQYPVDFEMANHYTSTHPSSSFVKRLTAQRCWPDGRVVLRNRDLLHQEGGRIRRSRVRSPTHLLHVLDHHFGLTFPADTRFVGSGLDF
jgi:N-hydroxyarylamine O-acetyltransferase